MKYVFFMIFIFSVSKLGFSDTSVRIQPSISPPKAVYLKHFGDENDQPLIFLHGGPGFHSYTFEATTAQALASNGYYVLVYDRTGEGRSSKPENYIFEFQNALEDLKKIVGTLKTKPILLGHSFGGTIALKFVERFPELTLKTIFVASPLSYPATLKNILDNSRMIAERNNCRKDPGEFDAVRYIESLLELLVSESSHSASLVGSIFGCGMACGLYKQPEPTLEANRLLERLVNMPQSPQGAFLGFLRNEQYSQLDITPLLKSQSSRTFAILGDSDGMFSETTPESLKKILGEASVRVIPNSSHDVFIHQQAQFIKAINEFVKDYPRSLASARR